MKRTTVSLPDELAQDVEREAQRRRVSVSQVTREALSQHFHTSRTKRLPFVGIGHSGKRDTARRAEEILAREWGDARGR
jgi:metal-responsive CopG/Arc/MetJ family transcriptional regulator